MYRVPLNLRLGRLRLAAGLVLAIALASAALLALVAIGDVPAIATCALVGGLVVVLAFGRQPAEVESDDLDTFELMPPIDLAVGQVEPRPGNVLVAVRHPHSLSHVAAALQAAGDRDVVVMTARLLGVDVEDDGSASTRSRRLPSGGCSRGVVALAERYSRPVRLLIVPAHNVFDAIVAHDHAAAQRRRSTSASRRRCRPTTRRGCSARPGSAPRSPKRSTSASSSTIAAAAPTRITSARTRPRSRPAIST